MNNYILLFRIKLKSLNSKNDNKRYHRWDFFFFAGGLGLAKLINWTCNMEVVGVEAQSTPWGVLQWPESGAVCRRAEG